MASSPRWLPQGQFLPRIVNVGMKATPRVIRSPLLPFIPANSSTSCRANLHTGTYGYPACLTFSRMASSQRSLHSSSNKPSPSPGLTFDVVPSSLPSPRPVITDYESSSMAKPPPVAPLSVLPLTNILRSLMTTTVSSSPLLLPPSLATMSLLAHTTNPLLNPDRNPLLRYLLKRTFYAQFCAGENAQEVRQTVDSLKKIGFSGVILGYAKEVVMTKDQTSHLAAPSPGTKTEASAGEFEDAVVRNEITPWADGTMETVRLASEGDFVALKFTGAGNQALASLTKRLPPSQALGTAMDKICQLASERGVRLLFDAEQQAVQAGIDDWTLQYMRKYNRSKSQNGRRKAVIYGTYQAYLKATPQVLSEHLAAAEREGFTLGVKLVRGAYLGSDPRHLIHDTKEDTDKAYDGIVQGLLAGRWTDPLQAPGNENGREHKFPKVDVVIASHNRDSVIKAKGILEQQHQQRQQTGTDVAFAQLQGMADEVSCELVVSDSNGLNGENAAVKKAQVYKYLVWGSTGECMKYLLRRAQENRDAVQRTRSGREAMQAELIRRTKGIFGFSG